MNEIVFQLMHDCDLVLTKETPDAEKWTYIELNFPKAGRSASIIEAQTPPRLIASHLPARYFENIIHEGGPKVILMLRNPKDTLVSMYHFYRMNVGLGNFEGTWDEFFEFHKNEKLIFEDFFKYYSAWMKYKDHPNVLFVKYEDLQSDHAGMIQRVAAHIGKQDLTAEQIASVVNLSTFSHMSSDQYKRNRSARLREDISKFYRKGKVGDWQNYFNDEQNQFIDNQYRSVLVPLGLTFDFVEKVPS